ncbi:dolichyl-diphosphooligosaccharide--protein glycosyltransferase subunit 1 [Cryptotrichosporon argae]
MLPLLLALAPCALAAPPANYVNTAVARTIELGTASTLVTTQYNVKALRDDGGHYLLALGGQGEIEPAWWDAVVGGESVGGVVVLHDDVPSVSVPLGNLKKDGTVTISLTTVLTGASVPLPAEIEQRDPQYLLWTTKSTYVDSWYPSDVERIKIRSPTPQILSHSSVPTTYTRDSDVTKSASTLTLGPFHSLPATFGTAGVKQQPFSVHHAVTTPVMGVRTLRRSAEVSHWGANLNIQDEIALTNNGAKLKGHFSRLAHQQSRFHATKPAQVFTDLTLRLPPTAHSVYYYDVIGNVSTSNFRAGSTPATQKSSKVKTSARTVDGTLDLRPRYPILGGWNYTFTVGWDMPLADALKTDGDTKYLAVPFFTPIPGAVINDVELRIILPEGATEVTVISPFRADSVAHATHKTYLDSIGRPEITLTKSHATEQHAQPVYIRYRYTPAAQAQKPLTVAAVIAGLFVIVAGLRRVDMSIDRKPGKA